MAQVYVDTQRFSLFRSRILVESRADSGERSKSTGLTWVQGTSANQQVHTGEYKTLNNCKQPLSNFKFRTDEDNMQWWKQHPDKANACFRFAISEGVAQVSAHFGMTWAHNGSCHVVWTTGSNAQVSGHRFYPKNKRNHRNQITHYFRIGCYEFPARLYILDKTWYEAFLKHRKRPPNHHPFQYISIGFSGCQPSSELFLGVYPHDELETPMTFPELSWVLCSHSFW